MTQTVNRMANFSFTLSFMLAHDTHYFTNTIHASCVKLALKSF